MWSPALLDLPILYLGAGQDLQISARFLPAAQCCLPLPADDNATDMTYTVSNAMLITVKSVLDAPRIKALREQVVGPMPIVNAVSYKVPASTSVSREFTIPKGQFIRRIMISAHSKVGGKCAAVNNGIANLVSNAVGKLKNPLHYMPPAPIDYLEIKNGSQSMTLRAQQLKHLAATSFDSEYCIENPLLRKLRTVYAIDLSRWGEDYDSTGSGQNGADTVTVTFEVSPATFVLPGQAADQDLSGLDYFISIETVSFMACSNSIYGAI